MLQAPGQDPPLAKLQGVPLWFLLETSNFNAFDIMKVDIEGSEGDVFHEGADLSFLARGKLVIIEIHDDMWHNSKPGENVTQVVTSAFQKFSRWKRAEHQGEHDIWFADE